MMIAKSRIEYGDFQTPRGLADSIVAFLRNAGISPSVIVEPTCGLGSFVLAAIGGFHAVRQVFAYDIKADYVPALRKTLRDVNGVRCHVAQQDFFTFNWKEFFAAFRGEILVLGNPPWVTNAALGALGSDNLPKKTNFQRHSGFAAKTGKANFDISEWILIKLLGSLDDQRGCLAMLCKTATARKVLRHGWINRFNIGRATIHIFVAFLAYCLHVTLKAQLRPHAPGLAVQQVLDKFAAMQLLDVHSPTTDGRELIFTRCTEPEPDQQVLLAQLGWTLPAQPPPRITAKRAVHM